MISKVSNQSNSSAFSRRELTAEEKMTRADRAKELKENRKAELAEKKYYADVEKQKFELEDLVNDEKTPKIFSKPARALIILSSGVLSFGIMKVSLGKSIDVMTNLSRKLLTSKPVLKARIAIRHVYRNGVKAIKNSKLLEKPLAQKVKIFFTSAYDKIMKNKYVSKFIAKFSEIIKSPKMTKAKETLNSATIKTKAHAKNIVVNTLAGASAVTGAMTGAGLTNRDPMAVLVGEPQ